MSDVFYRAVVGLGSVPGWLATQVAVLGAERVPRTGGVLLASNHVSPMDVPVLMYTTPRRIDFVSTVEVMGVPGVGAFYRRFNTMTLDRGKVDSAAVRAIVRRLRAGRTVGMFPEGRLTPEAESVTRGGTHRPGLGRIARLAGAAVVPAVVFDSRRLTRAAAWLPLKRTRLVVAYGEPLHARTDLPTREAQAELEARWRATMVALAAEAQAHRR
ncbi:MAG: lysophospholipid acyltransferase family protein [Planctomycetota bacterium]